MEAIRNIQTVKNGEVHLQLPQQFWGQEVEIIVLPAPPCATTVCQGQVLHNHMFRKNEIPNRGIWESGLLVVCI